MRNFLTFIMCFASIAFAACDNDKLPEPVLDVVTDSDIIVFSASGGNVEIIVETNVADWTVVSNKDWCIVEKLDGKFSISCSLNENLEAAEDATVTVSARETSKIITVKQPGLTNLSENGTSNSYIVTQSGTYSFSANVIGNGAAGIIGGAVFHTNNPAIAPESAKLLWQDYFNNGAGLISSVKLDKTKTRVIFTTPQTFVHGNALIAVCDASDNILWSWHIWMPETEIISLNSETGYEIMNLNLGAITAERANPKNYGMLYQWGRKEPFPAAATLTGSTTTVGAPLYDMQGNGISIQNSSWTDLTNNNLIYAIQNPTVCLSNYAQYPTSRDWLKADKSENALWGNPNGNEKDSENNYINKGSKSCYDPCPVGWRVPPVDVFRNFATLNAYNMAYDISDFNIADMDNNGILDIADYNYGWVFKLGENVSSYFSAAARFDGQYAMLMGSVSGYWGTYWCNAPYNNNNGTSFVPLSFQVKNYNGSDGIAIMMFFNASRADAYSVRCIKE
ncbi:MAG: BACON domain-containing protein [Prevotellaceae bacterium]|jgi:hypothetical protein|nr:BACON domain-containing protein [Prevotellaceae bacterium]